MIFLCVNKTFYFIYILSVKFIISNLCVLKKKHIFKFFISLFALNNVSKIIIKLLPEITRVRKKNNRNLAQFCKILK